MKAEGRGMLRDTPEEATEEGGKRSGHGGGLGPCGRPTAKVRLGVFSKCSEGVPRSSVSLASPELPGRHPPPLSPPPSEQ